MKNVNIGKTGLNAFNIGLGTGVVGNAMMYPKVTDEMGKDLIHAAFDEGIDFIDTAYLYGLGRSEELIGETVKQRSNREKIVISTKVSPSPEFVNGAVKTDIRPSALRKAADEALIRLQTDYIDILFLHFPDSRTPLGEAADALAQLKKEGKIRAVGASNLDFDQLQEFNADATIWTCFKLSTLYLYGMLRRTFCHTAEKKHLCYPVLSSRFRIACRAVQTR